jgi:hypothetical protein
LYNRVDSNDPAASTLVITILDASGIETDATLKDDATFASVLAGTTDEVTNTNYARKVLTDSDLVAFAADNANDWVLLDFPDQTWTAVASGTAWSDAVVCYDPSSSGVTDSVMVPLTQHDFVKTPDGSDIVLQTPSGFFKAT